MSGNRKISLIDVTLRDAHQCLWATRMTTAMMAETAPLLDRAGFEAIDLVGGAVFDVCVRYLREDPWARMRILSSWVTKTPLIVSAKNRGGRRCKLRLFGSVNWGALMVFSSAAGNDNAAKTRYQTPTEESIFLKHFLQLERL